LGFLRDEEPDPDATPGLIPFMERRAPVGIDPPTVSAQGFPGKMENPA
jgi:hypothetical protein